MRLRNVIFSILAWVVPSAVAAQYEVDNHGSAAVTCEADGDFVVVWHSRGQDGDTYGIFGQRFDSAGERRESEFLINTYTTDSQLIPSVCSDMGGNFVVVWQSYDQDGYGNGVFARRYDSAGAPRGAEFQVNTYTPDIQGYPAVSCEPDGDFVIAWSSGGQDGDYYGIFGRRYDSAGTPRAGEFQVNTYTTYGQVEPVIAADAMGNFVVAWASYDDQDGSAYGVFGQRFNSSGERSGTEFQVNTFTTNNQFAPTVFTDSSGNFVVAWSSGQDGDDNYGVFGQRYDALGSPSGTEFHVNTYTAGYQGAAVGFGRVVAGAASDDGEFVIVWQSTALEGSSQDGDAAGVFGQRFGGSPVGPLGTEFQINSTTSGNQGYPAVCRAGSGSFVVVWQQGGEDDGSEGIFGQRFDSAGARQGTEFQVNSDTARPGTPCTGDCDGNGSVTIAELVTGVNIVLERRGVNDCPAFDNNQSGDVAINELVAGVNAVLDGCPDA